MPATPFLAVCFPNMKHSYACYVSSSPLLKRYKHVQLPAKHEVFLKKGKKIREPCGSLIKWKTEDAFTHPPFRFSSLDFGFE